uniref:glycosyltransferase family 32 protein n=1 Tax=uncultured Sphingomonas sp. TaxID=158754 RepID=UPI0035CB21C5
MPVSGKNNVRMPTIPTFLAGTTIPKVIHQTFPTRTLPEELAEHVLNLKKQNPEWQHILYDDADIERFITAEYGADMLAHYHRISPLYGAARADFFRYLLLYKCGGLYLDIKSGLTRPLDVALQPEDRFILSQWDVESVAGRERFGNHPEIRHPGGEFQQWQIISVAGHPFLREVIQNVVNNIATYNPWKQGTGGKGVYRVTGPIAYTTAIEPLTKHHPHRLVKDTDFGLIYSAIQSSHKPMFKGHYLTRTDPIVVQRGLGRVSGWTYDLARRAKRYIF